MAGLFGEYDDIVKSASTMANPQLRGSLYGAADTNPDEETVLQKLAKKTGLPVESLRNDKGAEARRQSVVQESEALPPATSSFLADPQNAAIAHDDTEKLAELERVARNGFGAKGPVSTLTFSGKGDQEASSKAHEYVDAVLGGFKSSPASFNAGLAETGRIAAEGTGWAPTLRSLSDLTGNETFRNIADAPRLAELYWESIADEARVKVKGGTLPYYLQSAAGSLGTSLMAAPFGMAGEGPALGIFGLSASGGQEDLAGAGYSEQQAAAVSIPKKIMEGLTEKIGLDALYKGGKPLLKAMTEFVLGDLAGEEINTVYNAIADKVTIKPDMTWNDLGQDVVDTAIVTGLMGGAQGAAFHGSAKAAEFLHTEFEQSRRTRAAVNFMESLGDATKESKTFQRMPEKLRDIIGQVTADGPVENVYVPAEKIRELFQGKVAEPDVKIASMLDDPESYYQALAVGGDVVIPLPEYVEKWAGSEYHQALIDDIRLHPGDMTQRELKEWSGKMPEEFGSILKGFDEEGKDVTGDQKVHDEILGELLGAGRDRSTAEREALLWQSRYRSRAERLGKDAWELYQENPVRIKRPVPEFMTRRDFVDTSIDPFLDRLRSGDVPTQSEAMGTSLVEFLRGKGMKDDGGELASLGADEGRKPFQKKLSREDGLPLDKAREAAAEAGYLPADSTISDFLDLVDKDLRGAPVYAAGMENEGATSLRSDMEQLQRFLESHGVDVATMSNEEIRKAMKGISAGETYNQGATGLPRLIVNHNLSSENLIYADEIGGLAVPSLAITPENVGHESYGDITLIGTEALGNPEKEAVVDSDAYSATFPRPEYPKVSSKVAQKVVDEFRPYARPFGESYLVDAIWDNAVNYPNPAKTLEEISRYSGVKAKFLHEVLGVEVTPVMAPVARNVEWSGSKSWREYVKNADWDADNLASDDPKRQELYRDATIAAKKAVEEFLDGLPGPEGKGVSAETKDKLRKSYLGRRSFGEDGELLYNVLDRARRDIHENDGKEEVNRVATAAAADKELVGHEAEFKSWLEEKILGMYGHPYLKMKGRKASYTLDNIVEFMTAQSLRGSEKGMTFGSGAARAVASQQFVDLEKMREAAAENILPKKELDVFRKHAEALLEDYRTKVAEFYKGTDYRGKIDYWNAFDDSMKAIARWAKGAKTEANLQAALSKEGFKKVPAEILSLGVEAGSAMLKAPVPYFEGKPQRAVKLKEFAGAVVPDDASPEVLEILKKNGIVVKKYGERFNEEARHQAATDLREELQSKGKKVFFQDRTFAEGKRGSITFGPGFRDIALLEKADLSTFIHESGHAWLEELRQDATSPDAPDQVRKDWETVAAWAGVLPDASTIVVEAHEKFARAVEAYLMEGNAPSVELQPAFQRFKAWLLRIYREVRNLNVDLTDEVRGVFDRLLATDEEIKRAEELQGFHALFTDAAAAGMTDKEFAAYRKEVEKAHVEAESKLQQKLMAEITREQKAWWKEEREKVLGEVTAEAKQDPIYLAFQVLTNGTDFEGNPVEEGFKLSKDDLVRMYGKEFVKKLPRAFRYLYAKEGGIHPDAAAEVLGFSSGDEMIRKMANTPPLKKFVEAETDVRMREVYGDMMNDGTIADEALKAIHSDYQGQVLRAELRALRRKEREVAPFVKAAKAGKDAVIDQEKREREYERRWMDAEKKLAIEIERGAAAEEIRKIREEIRTNKEAARRARHEMEAGIPPLDAFKAWAAQTIGAKSIRSILPAVYARAEQKAGKAAFEAAAKGGFVKAGEEKQTQLLNHYLYLEAVQAKEDSEKIYDYARRLEKPSSQSRIGKAGENYLEQINGILERYEFKKQTLETLAQRQTLVEWIKQQEELGLEPSIPEELIQEIGRKNYKELTIDELRAIRDALKNIEHLSREMNRIRVDNEEIELDLAISELSASVTANFDPKRIPIDKETKSWIQKQGENISRFDASLIKAEQLVEWMDGGAIDGPWARMIFRPIAAAEAKEHALTLTFTKKLSDLVEAYGAEKRKALMEKVYIPSIDESITRQAAISAALNTGNESNRTKLLEGYGWQEGTLNEILVHLDADDWTFVQLTWDTIEELWPEIAALEKRLTGVPPQKVISREFTNDFGTWRGGYFPVVYDPLHSAAGEKQEDSKGDRLFESSYVRATTEKGHTKARIEGAAYPILLSLEVIPSHMVQVIHDLSHREAVVTANRLLNNKEMRVILNSTIGAPYYKMLKQWLATVANDRNIDRTGNEFWTRFMGTLRTNATVVGMGFRMSTMLAQIVGFSQSLDIVKGKYLGPAILRFTRHPAESLEWVNAKSGEMLNRRNSLDRDIRDGIRKMMGKHGAKQWIQAKAFAGIGLFDAIVSVPTWMGGYEQAKAEGLSEKDAVESGDRAVRLSQGSGGAKDLAAVQRSNDFMKLFTMFYSYFSVLYNRLRNMGRLKAMDEITWLDVAYKSFIMVMVPAIMGELIAGRGPDDDDDKAWWMIRKILAYPFMTIPFLRDIVNSTESGRPYSLTPVSRLFEMTAKLPSQVEAVANNQKDLSDLLFQVFDAPGYAFGIPTGQARTTTKYIWDVMEGDVRPEDMGDVLKGLAFGHHKKLK